MISEGETVLFSWELEEFATLVANCEVDETCVLALAHLPKQGKILEAGCGPGHVVRYLGDLGYDIEGIELNKSVVDAVNTAMPDLRVRWGDVTGVPVPDGYYAGLVSFGVIEHIVAGPAAALAEHYRVLRPGGVAVISVPSFNLLRRVRDAVEPLNLKKNAFIRSLFGKGPMPRNVRGEGGYRFHVNPRYGKFFEYHLTQDEFTDAVRAAGFRIIESLPTHHLPGLWIELGERWVHNRNRRFAATRIGDPLDRLLRRIPFCHNHMHTIVATR